MKRTLCLLLVPLVAIACGDAKRPHVAPGEYVKAIQEGSLSRRYLLRVPPKYDDRTKLPVVVLLHGWTSNAAQVEAGTQFGAKADKENFILIVPDGTPGVGELKGWNVGFLNLGNPKADDSKLISDILDQTEKDLAVDASRVFVAGHSNGAMMAYTLASKLGDRLAAIAVVSGTIGIPGKQVEDPKSPVSAIIIHGRADDTVPYDRTGHGLIEATPAPECAKWWADKDGCSPASSAKFGSDITIDDYKNGRNGAAVELVSVTGGGHNWPDGSIGGFKATDAIWDFFKSHPRP